MTRARYGGDGGLVRQTLPGELTAVTVTDAAGDPVSLAYGKADGAGDWLRSTATVTGFDQVASYETVRATGTGGSTGTVSRFGYDGLGRLVSATDSAPGASASCTRSYGFDRNSNRKSLTRTSAGAPAGTCPTGSVSYDYDTADRLLPTGSHAALRYDRLGRTRLLPSSATVDGGGDLTVDVYVNDLVASLTQNGRTAAFGLDPALRRTVRADTDSSGVTRRTVSHYTGDDDNPDSVTEPDGTRTRNVAGLGPLAAIVSGEPTSPTVTLQLANLHGDVAATLPAGAASPAELQVSETTEFGLPRTSPTPGGTLPRYGWLGTHQRDSSTPGGLTLMGVRLYSPVLGRFLTVDPVEGGSANTYDYVSGDPVNNLDLDGRRKCRSWDAWCRSHGARNALGRVGGGAWRAGNHFARRLGDGFGVSADLGGGLGQGGLVTGGWNKYDGWSNSVAITGDRKSWMIGFAAGFSVTWQSGPSARRQKCAAFGYFTTCSPTRGQPGSRTVSISVPAARLPFLVGSYRTR